MDLSTLGSLEHTLKQYLETAAKHEDLEITHLLSTSPESPPLSSSSEDEDEGAAAGGIAESSVQTRRHKSSFHAPPVVRAARPIVTFDRSETNNASDAFVPVAVPKAAAGVSALTQMLRSGGQAAVAGIDCSGRCNTVRIFGTPVPGEPMTLAVPERATMVQCITMVLQRYGKQHAGGEQLESSDFELLMAEDDGEPDEDMPKLSREQVIGDFGHSDFALRRLTPVRQARESISLSESSLPGGLLRVHLPRANIGQQLRDRSVLHKVSPSLTLAELMAEICSKPKVQLDPAKHVFCTAGSTDPSAVSAAKELDMKATIASLGLDGPSVAQPEVLMRARTYADAPLQRRAQPSTSFAEGSGAAEKKDTDFVFSDVTASRYKEYPVVKVNKRGVRQDRVLGIDRQRLYNIARDTEENQDGFRGWGLKTMGFRSGSGGTKHPSHQIRDILDASMCSDAPCDFVLRIKDALEFSRQKEYRYEAETNHDAAEIVAKLQYLMRLNKSQKLVSSKRDETDSPPISEERMPPTPASSRPAQRRSSHIKDKISMFNQHA